MNKKEEIYRINVRVSKEKYEQLSKFKNKSKVLREALDRHLDIKLAKNDIEFIEKRIDSVVKIYFERMIKLIVKDMKFNATAFYLLDSIFEEIARDRETYEERVIRADKKSALMLKDNDFQNIVYNLLGKERKEN